MVRTMRFWQTSACDAYVPLAAGQALPLLFRLFSYLQRCNPIMLASDHIFIVPVICFACRLTP